MKLYAISGLGADHRVFGQLQLKHELVHLKWITPKSAESLQEYARRLTEQIPQDRPFGLIGVSFGGLIAVEISKLLKPIATIVISSATTRLELPFYYRLAGRISFLKYIPTPLFIPPNRLAGYFFGATNDSKDLLYNILEDTDPKFAKWAVQALTKWKNTVIPPNLLKISGTKDKILANQQDAILIKNGQHFMIWDRAEEVSSIINNYLEKKG